MSLRLHALLLAVCVLGFTSCEAPPQDALQEEAPVRSPNLIFIMADDLGYGDLGVYGQTQIQTPRLDRMAAEGIRFTQYYAGATVCAPSRNVLMTGRHTGHTHVRGNKEVRPMGQEPLPDSLVTVAEVLRDAGYTTALIGKWGLGGPASEGIPTNQGFDTFFGYLGQRHAHNYYPEYLFRGEAQVPLANRLPEPKREDGAGHAIEQVDYSHDLFVEEALTFIDENRDRPFFLYLALTIPHANNEAGTAGMEVPDYGPYADNDWPETEKGMAAMVTRMDHDVGRILDRLDVQGLSDQTIVFFTSDNGPHREGGHDPDYFDSNGPLRGIKRDLYEGGIRVPMIVWGPTHIPAGQVNDQVWAAWDFLPTAAALAGTEAPAHIDGLSMAPALTGRGQARQHDYLYWEFIGNPGVTMRTTQAIRVDRWKAVRTPIGSGEIELYDLGTDLGEQQDVARQHPDVVAQMGSVLDGARVDSPVWPIAAEQ